jgi:hypothetical protein
MVADDPDIKLGFASKDARDFNAALLTQKGDYIKMW